jgi:hypothetical protein
MGHDTNPADDAGTPNPPGVLNPGGIIWAKSIEKKWWRNAHEKAAGPLEFSNADGRFSHPTLPFRTLYLGSDGITCFWESGLGRNLIARFVIDRTIPNGRSHLARRIPCLCESSRTKVIQRERLCCATVDWGTLNSVLSIKPRRCQKLVPSFVRNWSPWNSVSLDPIRWHLFSSLRIP